MTDDAADRRAGTAWPGLPQVDSRNAGATSAWMQRPGLVGMLALGRDDVAVRAQRGVALAVRAEERRHDVVVDRAGGVELADGERCRSSPSPPCPR